MISVRQLSKHYNQQIAVDRISFDVNEGETLIILGSSGCGKTTTLKMLNRLIEPTSGDVAVNGVNIKKQSPEQLRRGIGYVLQNTGLFPHYTIEQNIAIVPNLLKWDKAKTTERMHELMQKLHLQTEMLRQYPSQLSGGQQQRVGLARALIADPPVLLMDEPFGALDNITRTRIQTEFKELDELKRKTIVMVTHDVQEAFELADRICLMDQGHIIQIGKPQELLFKPANDFVKQFLEGQRLQLELRLITLEQLWYLLEATPTTQSAPNVNAKTSVWDCLNIFGQKHDAVTVQYQNGYKAITFQQLMSAFNQYQKQTQSAA